MSNDLWRTPPEVFNTLNKEFEFVADMAASKENALLPIYFTEEDDSLSLDWSKEVNHYIKRIGNHYVWVNCPYSSPLPWVKKALDAQKSGLGAVMLLNADTSIGWFIEALKGVSEIRFIIGEETPERAPRFPYAPGRLAFLDGEGKPINSNNKPQFILVFNPFKIGYKETSYIEKSSFYKELHHGN